MKFINLLGYHLIRVEEIPFNSFFALLRKVDYSPSYIFDIGANRGQWTRRTLTWFPEAEYLLLEPQDHLKSHITDLAATRKVRWIHAGAGNATGKRDFQILAQDDSSTFLAVDESRASSTSRVDMTTLDDLVRSTGGRIPDLVKIDAEGFDLQVLEGSSGLFGKTEIFLVEAAVCSPVYYNTVKRVIEKMDEAGYALCDITDLNRGKSNGCLWLVELAFVRINGNLIHKIRRY